jgi:hypothetical protein
LGSHLPAESAICVAQCRGYWCARVFSGLDRLVGDFDFPARASILDPRVHSHRPQSANELFGSLLAHRDSLAGVDHEERNGNEFAVAFFFAIALVVLV